MGSITTDRDQPGRLGSPGLRWARPDRPMPRANDLPWYSLPGRWTETGIHSRRGNQRPRAPSWRPKPPKANARCRDRRQDAGPAAGALSGAPGAQGPLPADHPPVPAHRPALHPSHAQQRSGPSPDRRPIDRLYVRMIAAGQRPSTVHHVHVVLSGALTQAVKWEMVRDERGPEASPHRSALPRSPTTLAEVLRLVEAARNAKSRSSPPCSCSRP